MSRLSSPITAILGPTNTGKTHLAVERLCAHSSGIMGFPLRLLAREVYDRVVAIKGPDKVGLVTGEERILPPDARWLLCTAESMPLERDVAFVAIDEVQLSADDERGHIFTDRMLRARGREETLLLGSETMRGIIRRLVPEAEIVGRPRFSRLEYAGPKKLSRLPPRSVVVAFSTNEVYALAEALRRSRGGAAVVMGSLSPKTRNAQVALFQSGEVDYLVATDAVGMGLNLDVGYVAFAGLSKFDGRKERRLTTAEMAQIAGRAGRHHRDGSFGMLVESKIAFSDAEIERLEEHRFPAINSVFWRNNALDCSGLDALIQSLEMLPDNPELRASPEAIDLGVLRALALQPQMEMRVQSPALVRRLWEACSLPDFRKLGTEHHAQLVATLFDHLGTGAGTIPHDWIAREVTRLDSVRGDVDTLSGRIAATRTWSYVAHRRDWLADPAEWAERTRALEGKLSDALHQRLIERFVDRRTSILMKALSDHGAMAVTVTEAGNVCVEDEPIGTLSGFRFQVDPKARLGERKRLLAAAERHLPTLLADRVKACVAAPDSQFGLGHAPGEDCTIKWRDQELCQLAAGPSLLRPELKLGAGVAQLPHQARQAIEMRLRRWVESRINQRLPALLRLDSVARDKGTPPAVRALLATLVDEGGFCARDKVEPALAQMDGSNRHLLHRLGLIIGTLDVFHPLLLKPDAVQLSVALRVARSGQSMVPLPMPGLGLLDRPSAQLSRGAAMAGYRRFGSQMLRIDLVERIARATHDARGKERQFTPNMQLATSLGVGEATFAQIMRALGFHPLQGAQQGQWRWHGRRKVKVSDKPINAAFEALVGVR